MMSSTSAWQIFPNLETERLVLRESFLVEDVFVDSLIYSLLRKNWEPS